MGGLEISLSQALAEYSGRRVLVTGDTGFKGSWLALWLKGIGAEVMGLALPCRTSDDHFQAIQLDKLIRHVDVDIRDLPALEKAWRDFDPEVLFHLAAQPLVRLSYSDPKTTFDTNVGGTVNLLELVRTSKSLRAVVVVTSDKCYSNKEWFWGYRENDELGGHDPYSASKAAAEIVFSAYQKSFFENRENLGAASVRAGNVIGGGDWCEDRIVPDSIRALRGKKPIVLRNPNSIRPWQHVLDPLCGYLILGSQLLRNPHEFSGSWNFGPSETRSYTVRELTEKLLKVWGEGKLEIELNEFAPHEARYLMLCCDKAHRLLGWRARWDFARTVEATVEWYKGMHLGSNCRDLSVGQIKSFMEAQA